VINNLHIGTIYLVAFILSTTFIYISNLILNSQINDKGVQNMEKTTMSKPINNSTLVISSVLSTLNAIGAGIIAGGFTLVGKASLGFGLNLFNRVVNLKNYNNIIYL
jgi:hypothetical protein